MYRVSCQIKTTTTTTDDPTSSLDVSWLYPGTPIPTHKAVTWKKRGTETQLPKSGTSGWTIGVTVIVACWCVGQILFGCILVSPKIRKRPFVKKRSKNRNEQIVITTRTKMSYHVCYDLFISYCVAAAQVNVGKITEYMSDLGGRKKKCARLVKISSWLGNVVCPSDPENRSITYL